MHVIRMILIGWWVLAGAAPGQAPLSFDELKATYESGMQNVARDFQGGSTKAQGHYAEELKALAGELQKLGDLHAVVWINRELQRFETMKLIPDDALAPVDTPIRTLQERYRKGAQQAASLNARKTYALTSKYLEKVDYQIRLSTARNEQDKLKRMNEEIQRVKTSTAFTTALTQLSRQSGAGPEVPVEARRAPGNVALLSKGALGLAETGCFEMIDGISDTYDARNGFSQGRCPAEFKIYLADVYLLNRIRLKLNDLNDQKYQYRIETSVDAEHWTPLVSQDVDRVTGWQTHVFEPRAVQDIRIVGLLNSGGPHFKLVEVEAYCAEE
ncbi:MAG: hypothetical protein ACI9TH_000062 [Kiritimatiellia bacterium]|jgi:hypothetical protein